ncbi:MAG: LemA family protein [Alistipes sp.]|nr:LemA family protein [Alistipes sp.]
MNKKTLFIILGIVAVVVVWAVGGYNGLVTRQEKVNEAWANVETVYQRRADLIPNLVSTVKGYAAHEQETLQSVTEARAKATAMTIDPSTATPEELASWQRAQQEVSSALGRLLAISESYPDLKANQNFLELQQQLEGTENRISTERRKYNEMVRGYNASIRRFPKNILAGVFGFEKMMMFEAQEGAEVAPEVVF